MKLSIVIPVYNEGGSISQVLETIRTSVKTENEILIVYDFEKDNTVPAVKNYLKQNPTKNIYLTKNSEGKGKGALNAIKTGFKKARGGAIIVVMGDLSDDIGKIDQMYRLIEKGFDVVCGSRYMKGGKKIGGPIFKTFLSRTAGLTLHYFFRIPTHDATNAFKMYRKEVLDSIGIESTGGYEYSMEILIKAFRKGYKITEVPTTWTDRTAGKSNFKLLKWLPKYVKWYFKALKSSTR